MAGEWNWNQFATGGATRPDSFSGMDPRFSGALQQLFAAAPPDIQAQLRVSSGYRSPERQSQLYDAALAKYGSPEAARKWVAPPGRSNHNHGYAADLKYLSPDAMKWAHANAGQFGLAFPLGNENWHIELAGVRGGDAPAPQGPTMVASAAPAPSAPVSPPLANLAPQAMALMTGGVPAPGGAQGNARTAGPALQNLAAMFMQGQQMRQQQREEEQAAEQERRTALLSQGVAGLYG